jgi:hypothetical protein
MQSMLDSVKTIKPATETLYNALTDAQKKKADLLLGNGRSVRSAIPPSLMVDATERAVENAAPSTLAQTIRLRLLRRREKVVGNSERPSAKP